MKRVNKKTSERINLYMDLQLFNEVKQMASNEFLPTATWIRQLIRKNLKQKNNLTLNNEPNGK
jgi:predicted DNA binding CopG/RHH family protein